MNMKQTIDIAKDFAIEPYGRYPTDGDDNGTRFREEWLAPSLKQFDSVMVILDGTEGYGSSFLEEAFGGLVRHKHFTSDDLQRKLHLQSNDDPSLPDEIWGYINRAKPGSI
jgi:hypothetical protein